MVSDTMLKQNCQTLIEMKQPGKRHKLYTGLAFHAACRNHDARWHVTTHTGMSSCTSKLTTPATQAYAWMIWMGCQFSLMQLKRQIYLCCLAGVLHDSACEDLPGHASLDKSLPQSVGSWYMMPYKHGVATLQKRHLPLLEAPPVLNPGNHGPT